MMSGESGESRILHAPSFDGRLQALSESSFSDLSFLETASETYLVQIHWPIVSSVNLRVVN
jgi:hypothetical protein